MTDTDFCTGDNCPTKEAALNLINAVDGAVDAIERLKSVLLDLKKIKENKND